MLISFGLTSNQAFAGIIFNDGTTCADCQRNLDLCDPKDQACIDNWNRCLDKLMCRSAVGGDMIQMKTTSILAAGVQYTMAWMIPTLIAAVGIGIVIARKI